MQRDSMQNTFVIATSVCVFWSVLVSTAAVMLRPEQERQKALEKERNIRLAAGIQQEQLAAKEFTIEPKIVNLNEGRPATDSELKELGLDPEKPEKYDQRAAAKDPTKNVETSDSAGFKYREKYALVYLVKKEDNTLDQVVLPIYGNGLWSTLYGFISLGADRETIRGITFYEHGETPGLGGEIENSNWQEKWQQKKVGSDGIVKIRVARGTVDSNQPDAEFQVDGLAGATITSRGVTDLVQYWLGEDGFGPFLANL